MTIIGIFKKIFRILGFTTHQQKVEIFFLLIFIIFCSLLEVFSVYLIIPAYEILINGNSIVETFPWIESSLNISFTNPEVEKFLALFCFAMTFLISNFCKAIITWQAGILTGSIGAHLFSLSYRKILSKPYELLSSENISRYSSNLITTNTYYVAVLKNLLLLVQYSFTTILLLTTLIYLNSLATIFAFIFLIIPYLIIIKIAKPTLFRISKQIALSHEEINRYIQEAFKSLKTIQHFNAQEYYTNFFYQQESSFRKKVARGEFIEGFPRFCLEGLGLTMLAILFGSSILIKSINVPTIFIITLIFSCQKILPTLQQIYRITSYVLTYSYSVDDLFKILYAKNNYGKKIKFQDGIIKFSNVFYSYQGIKSETKKTKNKKIDDYILKNINFEIKIPNSLSITGDSGCGKTTLVDLLTGLLIPTKGNISYPLKFKDNKTIGYVPQEVPIINGTFLENLCLGNQNLLKDKNYLYKCINLSDLDNTIKKFPMGLETKLGEQAINLSGGQKQRIGIARALLTKPQILVLDESTNALDSESEIKIIDMLMKQFADSLIILISHNKNITNKCSANLDFKNDGSLTLRKENLKA